MPIIPEAAQQQWQQMFLLQQAHQMSLLKRHTVMSGFCLAFVAAFQELRTVLSVEHPAVPPTNRVGGQPFCACTDCNSLHPSGSSAHNFPFCCNCHKSARCCHHSQLHLSPIAIAVTELQSFFVTWYCYCYMR